MVLHSAINRVNTCKLATALQKLLFQALGSALSGRMTLNKAEPDLKKSIKKQLENT